MCLPNGPMEPCNAGPLQKVHLGGEAELGDVAVVIPIGLGAADLPASGFVQKLENGHSPFYPHQVLGRLVAGVIWG